MDVIHPRCAGLDISKKDAKVCVRINGSGRRKTTETVTTFGATTRQIMALRDHLAAQQVTCVVMEATGDYWKPFYYLLEDLAGVEVMLVNARHVKNLSGRKTDVADAYLQGPLGTAAMSICHTRDTYLAAKYRRIAVRRGPSQSQRRRSTRTARRDLEHRHDQHPPYRDPGATTSPASTRRMRETTPSANWKPWATTSPLTRPHDRVTHLANSPDENSVVRSDVHHDTVKNLSYFCNR